MNKHGAADVLADHHARMRRDFRWLVPAQFNIAEVCSRRWAEAPGAMQKIAVQDHRTGAFGTFYSYFELQRAANALSNALRALGVRRGDRVGIVMPQRFETAVAYMAVLQMGAVALPLSLLFGPEALAHRLSDSGARLAITDQSAIANLRAVRGHCPQLARIVGVGADAASADSDWDCLLADHAGDFDPVATAADDGAVLIYTSGTTGPPKGALIPHRALIGNLSGFVCSQNWFGFDPRGDANSASPKRSSPPQGKADPHLASARPSKGHDAPVFWSPADWAWTGGLMDALLPTLYFGCPIVAYSGRFSPETAFELMQQHGVTHTFLFPTALKAIMKAVPHPRDRFELKLQAIMSAGEAVGDAVFDWCRRELGVTLNEMFGQTEINYIVGNCAMNGRADSNVGWPARAGSMGKGYPGHRVALIDDAGNECAVDEPGEVALCTRDIHGDPDPIFFLGYWKNLPATEAKFTGHRDDSWCRTGDTVTRTGRDSLRYRFLQQSIYGRCRSQRSRPHD